MITRAMTGRSTSTQRLCAYATMSLGEILDRIVEDADRDALDEFHGYRRPFRTLAGSPMNFIDFLGELCESRRAAEFCTIDPLALDRAHDLTLDKFYNLPSPHVDEATAAQQNRVPVKHHGPDCRYYFAACRTAFHVQAHRKRSPNPMAAETVLERLLTGHVRRHFFLSCAEAIRWARRTETRYVWQVDGHSLVLWIPREISGAQPRRWLEQHVGPVNPRRVGERDRVQSIINQLAVRRKIQSLDALGDVAAEDRGFAGAVPGDIEQAISADGLAETIATEKAENIHQRGPALQRLGKARLKEMIRVIFNDLGRNTYRPARIAREYGVSKSTLSRFAALRWRGGGNGSGRDAIPALWLNVAQILAGHAAFQRAARDAGVWPNVVAALQRREFPGGGQRDEP
jgi:hypothetical protein